LPPAPTTATYPLSLHDALPIFLLPLPRGERGLTSLNQRHGAAQHGGAARFDYGFRTVTRTTTATLGQGINQGIQLRAQLRCGWLDRKSTRLNSSHVKTSYAVFC